MTVTSNIVVSPRTPESPIIDPKTGRMAWEWTKFFQNAATAINNGLSILGEFIGSISPTTLIVGRAQIGTLFQHIDNAGVVQPAGISAATSGAQGGVQLSAGAVTNQLGSAALSDASAFDVAGSAATAQANAEAYADTKATAAQTNAETFATTAANTAQTNAETFASNASNLTSGTVAAARLPGGVVPATSGSGAPAGASSDYAVYYDTSVTPYQAYVYLSGAWHTFN